MNMKKSLLFLAVLFCNIFGLYAQDEDVVSWTYTKYLMGSQSKATITVSDAQLNDDGVVANYCQTKNGIRYYMTDIMRIGSRCFYLYGVNHERRPVEKYMVSEGPFGEANFLPVSFDGREYSSNFGGYTLNFPPFNPNVNYGVGNMPMGSSSGSYGGSSSSSSSSSSTTVCRSCEFPGNGKCKSCSGSGRIDKGFGLGQTTCPNCNGTGKCQWCNGRGK
ncbi:MAG: hypothetical protein PUD47_06025 [Bacteroidales bacterium]|nr:hypothetical protein [Bacteroidales bacterium]